MGFRREDYIRVNGILAERRAAAERGAEQRRDRIYAELPEIREVDRQLAVTGAKVLSAFNNPDAMKAIETENLALQEKRASLLVAAGYPADYTEPRYTCDTCRDTGFVGTKECVCRKRELVLAGCESSGIGALLGKQTFDTFSLSKNPGEKTAAAYNALREYAEKFTGTGDDNLLLVGGTGVGKTHLSSAVAGAVIERGFDVLYVTAGNMITAFEAWQFHRERGSEDPTERYYDCDLLIIDDLGTETVNSFVVSSLYDVLNERLNARRPTIVSTNLTSRAIRERYGERIFSRLIGCFEPVLFDGRDVRRAQLS